MKINHDRSYLNLWGKEKEIGITEEKINRLRFEINNEKIAINIADWLEENFEMYQYKNKKNYGKHQLFFWCNCGNMNYFTIDYNDNTDFTFEEWDQWTEKITKYINDNYIEVKGDVYLQYKNCIKWNEVNDYIKNTEFDLNNLPYNKLNVLSKYVYTVGGRLTEENKNKLIDLDIQLQNELLKSKENKKAIYNGIKGTIKRVKEGEYGFFKPRATMTYYPVRLDTIDSLEFI